MKDCTEMNILLLTDVYKVGHMEQYRPGTDKVYAYFMARSAKKMPATVFFGLQYYLQKYLSQPITHENVDEFLKYRKMVLGTDAPANVVDNLRALADRGHVSLEIKAIPEGSVVPVQNALFTITNTTPDAYWQVGFFESLLLKVWNTSTVATFSHKLYQMVRGFSHATCDNDDHLPFQVHDFGYRGVSSEETAATAGAAHLVNFLGTDTIPAIAMLEKYYDAQSPIGLSVPASEHSVMCSFGRDHEFEAFENMLNIYPTGVVSIVSDTYNLWNVLTNFADKLKNRILSRDGKVIFRPDSGDPEKIICGDDEAEVGSPAYFGALRLLDQMFGSSLNAKGYKILNPKVGLVYGDGFYYERFVRVLEKMESIGYASSNLVVGIGGILLQQHTRDDQGYALKATYTETNGVPQEIFKDPITDHKKKSHKGLLQVLHDANGWQTRDCVSWDEEKTGELVPVFKDGKMLKKYSLNDIRQRLSDFNSNN